MGDFNLLGITAPGSVTACFDLYLYCCFVWLSRNLWVTLQWPLNLILPSYKCLIFTSLAISQQQNSPWEFVLRLSKFDVLLPIFC